MSRTAVVAGATGLVGAACVRRLAVDPNYTRRVALVRRQTDNLPKEFEQCVIDFDRVDEQDIDPGADVFCALGTTIRTAGSKPAFRKVDRDYPLNLAKRAAACGARQFILVSSVGAGSRSTFYLRTKGETERAIADLDFESVHIFRPSLLLGERDRPRAGERVAAAAFGMLQFALLGSLRKYRAVAADQVAAAMVRAAVRSERGICIYHYDDIVHLAARARQVRVN